ncbi:MAG: hypothetical protein V4689_18080 [Verrucomicrobiota bacterium]
MNPISADPIAPPTIEQGVNALVEDVKHKVQSSYESCEQRIRKSPAKAVLVAVAAGYCLHRLPVRSMLVAQVRLLTALAPPALFAFGAAKLCEFLQNEARR